MKIIIWLFFLPAIFGSSSDLYIDEIKPLLYPVNEKLFIQSASKKNSLFLQLVDDNQMIVDEILFDRSSDMHIRSIQLISGNIFYLDAKSQGIRFEVKSNKIKIIESRKYPYPITGLENYFFYYDDIREVFVSYKKGNKINTKIFKKGIKVMDEETSFTVRNDNYEFVEYVTFIFHPKNNELILSSKSNNIWLSVFLDEQRVNQHAYGLSPKDGRGKVFRYYDHLDKKEFLIIENGENYDVFLVPDFHRIVFLSNDTLLEGKINFLPIFFSKGCAFGYSGNNKFLRKCL